MSQGEVCNQTKVRIKQRPAPHSWSIASNRNSCLGSISRLERHRSIYHVFFFGSMFIAPWFYLSFINHIQSPHSSSKVFSPSRNPLHPPFDSTLHRNPPSCTPELCLVFRRGRGLSILMPQRSRTVCTFTRRPGSPGISSARFYTVRPRYPACATVRPGSFCSSGVS